MGNQKKLIVEGQSLLRGFKGINRETAIRTFQSCLWSMYSKHGPQKEEGKKSLENILNEISIKCILPASGATGL